MKDIKNGFFAEEEELTSSKMSSNVGNLLKILIVDDEEDIHSVTKMILDDYLFEGRSIKTISAYSAKEAKDILTKEDDIALVLLDVIMESETAGLTLVPFIRKELKNRNIRIVLRTGQPGKVPEKKVMEEYDLDDYRTKTELTSYKLSSVIKSSLRTYTRMKRLESEIKRNEEKYEAHYNYINVPIALNEVIVDKNNNPVDFKFLEANPAFEELISLKQNEIIGKLGSEILPYLAKERMDIFGEIARTRESTTFKCFCKSYQKHWEVKVYSPEKNRFAIALTDITEQTISERELRKSEEKFSKIFHASPAIGGLSDLETGKYIEVNQAFYNKLGFFGCRQAPVQVSESPWPDQCFALLW